MSLFVRRNKLINSGFFDGFTDWHSHILPDVDDGVRTCSEAQKILDYFSFLGIKRVFLTPHIGNNTNINRDGFSAKFKQLQECIDGNIELCLSAEYMLDSGFEKSFKYQPFYLDNGCVLVETSCLSFQNNFHELLYSISTEGNIPVIAHPERYLYMQDYDYYRLKNSDYLFQLSLLSLSGYYGSIIKERAIYLLMKGMYDYIGTDIHDLHLFQIWLNKLYVTQDQLKMLFSILR